MIRLIFICTLIFSSCSKLKLKYPYVENNTIAETIYGVEVKDDYKWLEMDSMSKDWKAAQLKLTDKYLNTSNSFLKQRIQELNSIPKYLALEISKNKIYYLKTIPNTNDTYLCYIDLHEKKSHVMKDLGSSLRVTNLIKGSLSSDFSKLAVVVSGDGNATDLLIFDLTKDAPDCDTIANVRDYKPVWHKDKIHYIGDAFNSGSYGNRICSYDIETCKETVLYEGEMEGIFNYLDMSFDQINEVLYVMDNNNQQYKTYAINLKSQAEPYLIYSAPCLKDSTLRMAGVDQERIYFIKHNEQFFAEVFSYHITSKQITTVHKKENRQLTGFNQIKDHIVLSYNNMKDNQAFLINTNNQKIKDIKVSKESMFNFYNNSQDTILVLSEQTLLTPESLEGFDVSDMQVKYPLIAPAPLPYNPDDFETKQIKLLSDDGSELNFSISYKKGLELNGKNPTIVFIYPNSIPIDINAYHYSRIMYLEQGFIFVQRSYEGYSSTFCVDRKVNNMKQLVAFLCENNYTSKEYIALLGYEYGAAIAAKCINDDPSFCKAAIFSDGIFDLVYHPHMDNVRYHNKILFNYESKEELLTRMSVSPYHNIKYKADYPAILAFYGEKNKIVDPAHTYKYIAKLQMRTKGDNPVLLKPNKIKQIDGSIQNLYDDYVFNILSFFSQELGVKLSAEKQSRL